MALIVPSGGLISQVNGKVDDKVYYRGRWGNVVRAWVNPTNTITPQRTAVRALFASLMSLFNSLTPDMQDDWNKFAQSLVLFNRLAQPYVPTGLQVFMSRNTNLAIIGQGPLLLPPDDEKMFYFLHSESLLITPVYMDLQSYFTAPGDLLPANMYAVAYATNNQPAGRTFMSNRMRIVHIYPPGSAVAIVILADWLTVWNPAIPITGMKIFFKTVIINGITGQASTPVFCSKLVS